MAKGWPFSKPTGVVLGLRRERLSTKFKRLERKHTLTHQAHRFRFELAQPAQFLVQVSSTVADTHRWHRAGYLAHLLRGAPIAEPIADVKRLYFGQQYRVFSWTGLSYYLEFWPHRWISDYRIEVWAREALSTTHSLILASEERLLLFQTGDSLSIPFTFYGVPILFP